MKRRLSLLVTALAGVSMTLLAFNSPQDQPVSIRIISPSEGQRLTLDSIIEVEVSLNEGEEIDEVEVFLDDSSLEARSSPPFRFSIAKLSSDSVHRIRAIVRTKSGRRAVDTLVLKSSDAAGFAVRVDLVTLYVSITDVDGSYVRGLAKEDIQISENGAPQEISFFSSEVTPLTLALLMDVSSSMIGERIVRAQAAAVDLIGTLIKNEDQAMVLGFDHRLLMYQPLTNDVNKLERAIRLTGPNGGTALYDAVAGTAHKLFDLKGKRALIVLSDGDDTDSNFSFDEVLNYLQKTSVIVYSVGLQTLTVAQTRAEQTKETIRQLSSLAEITGGQGYFPSFISHLPGIYAAIGKDLNSQYTIAYYPSNKVRDGKWRSISVRIKGNPNVVVRHRKGYYASP